MTQPLLIDMFHGLVSASIDETGVFPHVGIVRRSDHNQILALAVDPEIVIRLAIKHSQESTVDAVIVGLDRFTRPGQGTELGDVITAYCWDRESGWRCGIIEYQHAPRIVRPWDWANALWAGVMARELERLGVHGIATAH